MLTKFPKDDSRFSWTRHIKNKMIFYGLSEQRIKSVLNAPKRKEEGIAPNTVAVMRRNDRGKKREEIWVMYTFASRKSRTDADKTQTNAESIPRPSALSPRRSAARKRTMISAWRYPGVSKPGREIPIPDEILEELNSML